MIEFVITQSRQECKGWKKKGDSLCGLFVFGWVLFFCFQLCLTPDPWPLLLFFLDFIGNYKEWLRCWCFFFFRIVKFRTHLWGEYHAQEWFNWKAYSVLCPCLFERFTLIILFLDSCFRRNDGCLRYSVIPKEARHWPGRERESRGVAKLE